MKCSVFLQGFALKPEFENNCVILEFILNSQKAIKDKNSEIVEVCEKTRGKGDKDHFLWQQLRIREPMQTLLRCARVETYSECCWLPWQPLRKHRRPEWIHSVIRGPVRLTLLSLHHSADTDKGHVTRADARAHAQSASFTRGIK